MNGVNLLAISTPTVLRRFAISRAHSMQVLGLTQFSVHEYKPKI